MQTKINENLYLRTIPIDKKEEVVVNLGVNHIIVVDVSGSMYYDLPKLRKQLKNRLPDDVKDGDTVSIIWFSGKNEAGILKEEVEIKSLKNLNDLNSAIDKFLVPIGLTGFLKPFELVKSVIDRIKNNRPNTSFSLLFLSDGYNNDSPFNEVLNILEDIKFEISNSVFIEYGMYADSDKLTKMAAILGGTKISCNGFEDYDIVFEKTIKTNINSGKKIKIDVLDCNYDIAFSIGKDSVNIYDVKNDEIFVNDDVDEIHYFTNKQIGDELSEKGNIKTLYAAAYILSDLIKIDEAEDVIIKTGDEYLYRLLSTAYGKQKIFNLKSELLATVLNEEKQYKGENNIKPIDPNTYCLIDLMKDLVFNQCEFIPNKLLFKYNNIGRKKVQVGDLLTEVEKERISNFTNYIELKEYLSEIESSKFKLLFKPHNQYETHSFKDLVWNEERANLSFRIMASGSVDLPANKFDLKSIDTYKYNTYTIIKDGIVNIDKLPIMYDETIFNILVEKNIVFEIGNLPYEDGGGISYLLINLRSLPIINKSMIKSISANELAKTEFQLLKTQAAKKVFDHYKNLRFPKESKSFINIYGQECADWLKTIGVTDYNGFAPKTVDGEANDTYVSTKLITKIAGISSLPKVEDVEKKIDGGKSLTPREEIMLEYILDYKNLLESENYKNLLQDEQDIVLNDYLTNKIKDILKQKLSLMTTIARIKFSLILSKKWFNEFKTFDENEIVLNIDNKDVKFAFEFVEENVEI